MAKKRRKRRPAPRPSRPRPETAGAAGAGPAADPAGEVAAGGDSASRRAERKEEARRDRERRTKQNRRKQRNRRLIRWGIVLLVIGLIAGFVIYQNAQRAADEEEVKTLAASVGCEPVETRQDDLDAAQTAYDTPGPGGQGNQIHEPPFAQGSNGIPVTAGRHNSPLPPDPKVYSQQAPEENVVHNLEHAYVIVYYNNEGDSALDDGLRGALEDYVETETKVLMMPYQDLANTLDFVAWGKLQTCDPGADVSSGDLVTVLTAFVEEYKNSDEAPEPNAA
jgi:uncharacterized protein DUF3105